MKKWIVAPLVGGLIIFIWQFLSWSAINLHETAYQYTPKQDAIMSFLNSQQLPEGGYILPSAPKTASMEEWQTLMKNAEGKPWASIQYHAALKNNMGMNMFRGVVIDFITVLLFCWILSKLAAPSFGTILLASIFTGLIVFCNVPYTNSIWYENFDTWAHLIDAIASWGLCGLWLGWWWPKVNKIPVTVRDREATLTA